MNVARAPQVSPAAAPDLSRSSTGGEQAQRRADETRRRILLSAARLFRDKGYRATTLRDIALASRLGTGSAYYHFGSKEDLLNQVLDDGIAGFEALVRAALAAVRPDAPELERLRAAAGAHLHALLEGDEFTRTYSRVYVQLPVSMRQRNHTRRALYFSFWRGLFEAAQSAGELHPDLPVGTAVDLLIAAMSRVHEWYKPEVNETGAEDGIDRLAGRLIDWLVRGIGPQRS